MKNIVKLHLFLFAILMFGCKHDKAPYDGPDLNDLYGSFRFLEPFKSNLDSVDFSASQTNYFTAKMNKLVDWKISIKGLSSGAEKIITGKSKTIDVTSALWNGSTSILPMFKKENCSVLLTFPTEKDSVSTTIKVINPKVNAGYIVADFESGFNNSWVKFAQSGASMDCQIRSVVPIPQGNNFYNMAGTVNWDWLVSLIEFPSSANGLAHFPLNTNPNNVYFNVLVWGEPGITNAILLFQLREDDNNNGTFESSTEDEYDYELKITWSGWRLITVKYSDLATLVNGAPSAPKGNQQQNPERLLKISALHLADPSSGFSKTKMDYLIFTDNKALEP